VQSGGSSALRTAHGPVRPPTTTETHEKQVAHEAAEAGSEPTLATRAPASDRYTHWRPGQPGPGACPRPGHGETRRDEEPGARLAAPASGLPRRDGDETNEEWHARRRRRVGRPRPGLRDRFTHPATSQSRVACTALPPRQHGPSTARPAAVIRAGMPTSYQFWRGIPGEPGGKTTRTDRKTPREHGASAGSNRRRGHPATTEVSAAASHA